MYFSLPNGKKLRVVFLYDFVLRPNASGKFAQGPYIKSDSKDLITCRVLDENDHLVGFGRSSRNPGDKYNKKLGRKLAFTRAISHRDKTERQALWQEYLKQVRV